MLLWSGNYIESPHLGEKRVTDQRRTCSASAKPRPFVKKFHLFTFYPSYAVNTNSSAEVIRRSQKALQYTYGLKTYRLEKSCGFGLLVYYRRFTTRRHECSSPSNNPRHEFRVCQLYLQPTSCRSHMRSCLYADALLLWLSWPDVEWSILANYAKVPSRSLALLVLSCVLGGDAVGR